METPDTKLDGIMRKLRALMERADHPETPPAEADVCRMKADVLMMKYKIESITGGGGKANSVTPTWKKMRAYNYSSEFSSYYSSIVAEVVAHVGGRGMISYEYDDGEPYSYLDVVGFESDLRYAEVLMVSCLLEFGKRLEPSYNPMLSDEENVYLMRHAGMERRRIAHVMFGVADSENSQKSDNRRVTRLFKAACEAKGEDPDELLGRGNNMAMYRESYAHGFVREIRNRLSRMRTARGGESSGLVLKDFAERVNEAFYEKYPRMRPKEGGYSDPRDGCEKCAKAKSGYCREHQYLKPRAPQYRDLRRDGYQRGKTAASMVDLGREGTTRANPAPGRGELG